MLMLNTHKYIKPIVLINVALASVFAVIQVVAIMVTATSSYHGAGSGLEFIFLPFLACVVAAMITADTLAISSMLKRARPRRAIFYVVITRTIYMAYLSWWAYSRYIDDTFSAHYDGYFPDNFDIAQDAAWGAAVLLASFAILLVLVRALRDAGQRSVSTLVAGYFLAAVLFIGAVIATAITGSGPYASKLPGVANAMDEHTSYDIMLLSAAVQGYYMDYRQLPVAMKDAFYPKNSYKDAQKIPANRLAVYKYIPGDRSFQICANFLTDTTGGYVDESAPQNTHTVGYQCILFPTF